MDHVTVGRVAAEHSGAAARLIAEAFHPLDVSAWLVPNPATRAVVLPTYFQIIVDHALTHGRVTAVWHGQRMIAVALWFIREGEPPPLPWNYAAKLEAACGEATPNFLHLDKLLEDHHPSAPHYHLASVAVHPQHQGDGLGTTLLTWQHERLDKQGKAAYLEAVEPARRLYARLGYRDVGDGPLRLPDGTTMWPMWRPAARLLEPPPAPPGSAG